MGHQIRAVGCNFQVKQSVRFAVERAYVRAQRNVFVQHQNAACAGAGQAQLVGRANHAFADHAAYFGGAQYGLAQPRTHAGQGDFLPHGHIRRAAYHALGFAAAQIQIHQMQVVGIGVVFNMGDLRDVYAFKVRAFFFYGRHFYAQRGQFLRQFFGRIVQVNEIFQPAVQYLHISSLKLV